MWVTKIKKNEIPYFELFFEEKIKLAKIIIYNYNQKDKLEIGTKEIDIYIDNYFYHKYNGHLYSTGKFQEKTYNFSLSQSLCCDRKRNNSYYNTKNLLL